MSDKILIILRGLPCCGKSTRAAQLKGNGAIFSTDEFFYKFVNPESPERYDFDPQLLGEAHRWNRLRAYTAMDYGVSPVIIDNTNTTQREFCCAYLRYANAHGYTIQIEEPDSPQWKEVRPLLNDIQANRDALKDWANKLAEMSVGIHDVPAFAIERMMWRWENLPSVPELLHLCYDTHES